MESLVGDVRDLDKLTQAMSGFAPDIVIHMAAQPLVRLSYKNPVDTYSTNVMGTVNLLEAVRSIASVKAVVNVTTDKCYENKEWIWPYRENEAMGGHDPYSSSKGCAELLIASYRYSFFSDKGCAAIASARAGNVIGGGDWSTDRLIPDIIKSFQSQQVVKIRSPNAIRPWQHVLEPLSGYLLLAEKLYTEGKSYAEAWNFGPKADDMRSVEWIVNAMAQYWGHAQWDVDNSESVHEAYCLKLDSSKAAERLTWQQQWCLKQALDYTIEWYQAEQQGLSMGVFSHEQINKYSHLPTILN